MRSTRLVIMRRKAKVVAGCTSSLSACSRGSLSRGDAVRAPNRAQKRRTGGSPSAASTKARWVHAVVTSCIRAWRCFHRRQRVSRIESPFRARPMMFSTESSERCWQQRQDLSWQGASVDCRSRDESMDRSDGLSMDANILPMSTSIPDMPTRLDDRPRACRLDAECDGREDSIALVEGRSGREKADEVDADAG